MRKLSRRLIRIKRGELTKMKFEPYPDKPGAEFIQTEDFILLVWKPEQAIGNQHAWTIVVKKTNRPIVAEKAGNKFHARVDGKHLLAKMMVTREVANYGKKSQYKLEEGAQPHEENSNG